MGEKRFLIETSAVPAALGFSSDEQAEAFEAQLGGGTLCTSFYIRKEVLRRWFCEIIELAQMVEMSSAISNAFSFWAENFGRKPKLQGFVDAALLRKGIKLDDGDTHGAAVEIAQIALDLLDMFDLKLKGRTNNTCGCQIGGMPIEVDGNDLLSTLGRFRDRFRMTVMDCPINGFLQFKNPKGRTGRLIGCEHLKNGAKAQAIRKPLMELYDAKAHITCLECGRIGDQVIALEQPAAFTLVHVDNSFKYLCECTGRNHEQIRSNSSFRPREAPKGHAPAATDGGNA